MAQRVATHMMVVAAASAALDLYAATFPDFKIVQIERYGPEQPGAEGTVKRAVLNFRDHRLLVIDSDMGHAFTFRPRAQLVGSAIVIVNSRGLAPPARRCS